MHSLTHPCSGFVLCLTAPPFYPAPLRQATGYTLHLFHCRETLGGQGPGDVQGTQLATPAEQGGRPIDSLLNECMDGITSSEKTLLKAPHGQGSPGLPDFLLPVSPCTCELPQGRGGGCTPHTLQRLEQSRRSGITREEQTWAEIFPDAGTNEVPSQAFSWHRSSPLPRGCGFGYTPHPL